MTLLSSGRRGLVGPSAALLVVAVAVAVAGFAAPAAADPGLDSVAVEDEDGDADGWIGTTEEYTVSVEASDVDTTDGAATVEIDLSDWSDGDVAPVSEADVSASPDTVEVVDGPTVDGGVVTFEINDTAGTTDDLTLAVDVELTHPATSTLDGETYAVGVGISDAAGTAAAETELQVNRLSYRVDGAERYPPATDPVFRNQTVAVTNLEADAEYRLFEFDPEDGEKGAFVGSLDDEDGRAEIDTGSFRGEPLAAGWYIVVDANETHVDEREENAFVLTEETLTVGLGAEEVDDSGDGARTTARIESNRPGSLDVNVTSPDLDGEDLFAVLGGEDDPAVERTGESAVVVSGVDPGGTIPLDFEPVGAATYALAFAAADTGAADNATVEVVEREMDASFGSDVYRSPAGDLVRVDLSVSDLEGAYVMIGGDRSNNRSGPTNYFDVLYVQGGGSFVVNTRLLGTDAPSGEVYLSDGQVVSYLHDPDHERFDDVTFTTPGGATVADDLEAFREEIGVTPLPWPLQPERYRLVAGADGEVVVREDGVPDFREPLARSNLHLTEPSLGNVTTYVAPAASASEVDAPGDLGTLEGELTERRTVARGDRFVIEVETTGLHGTLAWLAPEVAATAEGGIDPETFQRLLDLPEGVFFEATHTNPGRNEDAIEFGFEGASDGDVYVVPDTTTAGTDGGDPPGMGRYFVVIDTRGEEPFDRPPDDGARFQLDLGYEVSEADGYRLDAVDHARREVADDASEPPDHFPYFTRGDGNETRSLSFTVEDRRVEYDRTDELDRPIVANGSEAYLGGTTNVAPGSEVVVQLVAHNRTVPTEITIEDVEIASDGTFAVRHDLSELRVGEGVEVEFYVDQQLLDKRQAVVVGDADVLSRFNVTTVTNETTAVRDEEPAVVAATVENDGNVSDRQTVELRINGTLYGETNLALDERETGTVEFELPAGDVPAGEYEYTVSTDDDNATGRLVVEGELPESADPDEPGENETDDRPPDAGTPDPGPQNPLGDGPLGDGPLGDGLFGGLVGLVGARHAVGGAAIVGGIHVLGYWR